MVHHTAVLLSRACTPVVTTCNHGQHRAVIIVGLLVGDWGANNHVGLEKS
jgi:hypothetical protein